MFSIKFNLKAVLFIVNKVSVVILLLYVMAVGLYLDAWFYNVYSV